MEVILNITFITQEWKFDFFGKLYRFLSIFLCFHINIKCPSQTKLNLVNAYAHIRINSIGEFLKKCCIKQE
jgi:hypothetical protein